MELYNLNFRNEDVYITYNRIFKDERKPHLFYYDVRHNDMDMCEPCSLEESVIVNHWGTMVSNKDLSHLLDETSLNHKSWTEITEEEASDFYTAFSEGNYIMHNEL